METVKAVIFVQVSYGVAEHVNERMTEREVLSHRSFQPPKVADDNLA